MAADNPFGLPEPGSLMSLVEWKKMRGDSPERIEELTALKKSKKSYANKVSRLKKHDEYKARDRLCKLRAQGKAEMKRCIEAGEYIQDQLIEVHYLGKRQFIYVLEDEFNLYNPVLDKYDEGLLVFDHGESEHERDMEDYFRSLLTGKFSGDMYSNLESHLAIMEIEDVFDWNTTIGIKPSILCTHMKHMCYSHSPMRIHKEKDDLSNIRFELCLDIHVDDQKDEYCSLDRVANIYVDAFVRNHKALFFSRTQPWAYNPPSFYIDDINLICFI